MDQNSAGQIGAELAEAASPTVRREIWLRAGRRLKEARDGFGKDRRGFGAWVEEIGFNRIEGLETNVERSDAIWIASHPERVDLVPSRVSEPRAIRAAWHRLLKTALKDAVGGIHSGTLSREDAVAFVAKQTALTDEAASEELAKAAGSGPVQVEDLRETLEGWRNQGASLTRILRVLSEVYAS